MYYFLRLSYENFPIFPQSKVIKKESTEIIDGLICLNLFEDDPQGHQI